MSELNVLVQVIIVLMTWTIINFVLVVGAIIVLYQYAAASDQEKFSSSGTGRDEQLPLDLEFNDETKVKQDGTGYPAKGP